MMGYLSRIASQSGIRFSSRGAASPRNVREPHARSLPEPLDREESVIVSLSVESKGSKTGALKRSTTSEGPVPENIALESRRRNAVAKSVPELVSGSSPPEMTASPVGGETVLVTPETENSPKKQVLSSDESPVSAASESAPKDLEQSVFAELSGITDHHEKQSPDLDKAFSTEPKTPEKQYFARTAEIIMGRDAQPIEVQTILLREIQEWVAEGNKAESTEIAESDKSVESVSLSHETPETHEVVLTQEPKPGVVRIGEKSLPASIPQEASRIDEQNFDLSIGTISVVIEGDEESPQPAPAPRTESQSNSEHQATRQFSRLNRNYL